MTTRETCNQRKHVIAVLEGLPDEERLRLVAERTAATAAVMVI